MNVAIFYFSGTGNTMWVSEQLAEVFWSQGVACRCYSIEQVTAEEADVIFDEATMVGFGYPIYGSDLPEPMKNFVHGLKTREPETKPGFVFCTQMIFSGDGAWVFGKELQEKGVAIGHSAHFLMPSNISLTPWCLPLAGKRLHELILNGATRRAKRFVTAILEGKRFLNGKHATWLGLLQRAPYRKLLPVLETLVGVDETRCTRCGRCVRMCPVENIRMEDVPVFAGHCTECLRCYNFCPESAITYWKISHNGKKPKYQGPTEGFRPEQLR